MSNTQTKMRAKVRVGCILPFQNSDGVISSERLMLHGVAANRYPADGSDENNTFARFSPSVSIDMQITNPALIGAFDVGETFYVDFIPAPK